MDSEVVGWLKFSTENVGYFVVGIGVRGSSKMTGLWEDSMIY